MRGVLWPCAIGQAGGLAWCLLQQDFVPAAVLMQAQHSWQLLAGLAGNVATVWHDGPGTTAH
jgi:hypothetical protein